MNTNDNVPWRAKLSAALLSIKLNRELVNELYLGSKERLGEILDAEGPTIIVGKMSDELKEVAIAHSIVTLAAYLPKLFDEGPHETLEFIFGIKGVCLDITPEEGDELKQAVEGFFKTREVDPRNN